LKHVLIHSSFCFSVLLLCYRQPSDSYADGGGGKYGKEEEPITTGGDMNILFAPAAPADVKKKKKRSTPKSTTANVTTPKAKNTNRKMYADVSPCASHDTPTKSPPNDKMRTPPPIPRKNLTVADDDEDIWYAKWWVACFPDTFKNMMPKR
jgi:hypothetical protein